MSDTGAVITETDSPVPIASALFRRKFGSGPPERGRHFVCLIPARDGAWQLLTYVHFQPFGDTCLGGGACTDERVLRRTNPAVRENLRAAGGPYFCVLTYALEKMRKDFFAIFGHTSDPRATAIDLRAGFRPTGVEHLLIFPTQPLDETLERALIAKVAAVGAF